MTIGFRASGWSFRAGGVVAALSLLSACATDGKAEGPKSASASATKQPAPGMGKGYSHDPYPSTYKPYPASQPW